MFLIVRNCPLEKEKQKKCTASSSHDRGGGRVYYMRRRRLGIFSVHANKVAFVAHSISLINVQKLMLLARRSLVKKCAGTEWNNKFCHLAQNDWHPFLYIQSLRTF
jgi:adenylosuccinate synthase